MLYFRTGSQLHRLITLLSVAGEYPTNSLYLLGNERVYKDLVAQLTEGQTIRNIKKNKNLTLMQIVSVSGKGKAKTVRLFRGALPILEWLGAEEYYMKTFRSHKFSGDAIHKERNHRVAEAIAMFMQAGYESRQYKLPKLQVGERHEVEFSNPCFYISKYLKQVGKIETNKVMFTRLVGLAFAGENCYAVYNTRNAVMKWCGDGECKVKYTMLDIVRANSKINELNSAILFGTSAEVAIATLEEIERNSKKDLRLDAIYNYVHFVPLNEIGMRQLRLLALPNWKEQILDLLFEPEQRSRDCGTFEYDAFIDGVYVMSHLDGDLGRLRRFKTMVKYYIENGQGEKGKYEVLCFKDQVSYLNKYLAGLAQIRVVDRTAVETELKLKRRDIFEED